MLSETDTHPTAAMLFDDIHQQYPSLSLATVYNTLDALVGLGVVNVLGHAGDGKVHFDADTSPHINLACTSCHRVVDLPSIHVTVMDTEVSQLSGYKLRGARIMYYGYVPIVKKRFKQIKKGEKMETSESQIIPMPRIGDNAPEFKAVTTQGPINFPGDYSGSWVILFSHPADFTPVCTSEFMTFASQEEKFAKANCKLVGLSVDGLYSHIAWLRTIKEKIEYKGMKDVEVKFPLIEDITMEVAKKYGMIQPGVKQHQSCESCILHRS